MKKPIEKTVSVQGYLSQELKDFLEQDRKTHGLRSMSEEVVHALTEYAVSKGYQPQDEIMQLMQQVTTDPDLKSKLFALLATQSKNRCLCH